MNALARTLRAQSRAVRPSEAFKTCRLQARFLHQPTHLLRRTLRPILSQQIRRESSDSRPLTDRPDTAPEPTPEKKDVPSYDLTFTCKKCDERSTHRISKQGYHHGTILITCKGCKNRHLISDHLKIFSDTGITIEDILKEKGQLLKKGSLAPGEDGDIEFWDDETQTTRPSKA